ncbi:MAG: nitrile hydratase subunit beta, partial [Acidimicrobiia bacterium]|nr:nitrile hydratase subunit beta [Acidimicrobiia bacterium]
MNGVHDMGGMHGFGPLVIEEDEPVFHADWEARVRSLEAAVAALGMWTVDEERHTIEQMPPSTYLTASYYERW